MRSGVPARPWTEDEDLTLEENLGRISRSNYRKILPARTLAAVRERIASRGLSASRARHQGLSYTMAEASAILGVSVRVLRSWIAAGLIPDAERLPSMGRTDRGTHTIPWAAIDDLLTDYPMLFNWASFPPTQIHAAVDHRPSLARGRPEEWLQTEQAARLIHRHPVTLRSMAVRGRIQGRRVLGLWYFHKSHIRDYLRRSANNAQ